MFTVCLSVHEIARLQRRGASNTKTTYHSAKISPYRLITRRGIMDHPAQPLIPVPHFTVTSTSFSTTNSNSILGLGTVYLISHNLAAFILYSHSLHPPHLATSNPGSLELVPLSLSFRFRPWSRSTTDTHFK